MPLLKRVRTIAAAVEAAIGTPETLAAAQGVYNAYDIAINASIEVEQREAQGSFDRLSGVAGARQGTMAFKTDIYIGAVMPAWASVLFPACGYVATGAVFTPRSKAPGTTTADPRTVTIGVFEDGFYKRLAGATGNFKIVYPSGKKAFIEWEFQGVWQAPANATLIEPTYPTDLPIRFATGTATYNMVDLQVENITFDAGNEIVYREDPTTAAGYISTLITDRMPKITANPESVLTGTQDRFAMWLAATEAAFAITLAGPDSSALVLSAPKAQIVNNQEGDRSKLQVDDLEFSCNKNATTKDADVSITVTVEV